MIKKITIILLLILINIALIFSLFNRYTIKKNLEDTVLPFAIKNENPIFKIDKRKITKKSRKEGKKKWKEKYVFSKKIIY